MFHDEADGVSSLAAGEAFAVVLGRGYHERGRAVVVKRAEALEVGSGPFQGYEVGNDVDDVRRIHDFVYGRPVYHSVQSVVVSEPYLVRSSEYNAKVGIFAHLGKNPYMIFSA